MISYVRCALFAAAAAFALSGGALAFQQPESATTSTPKTLVTAKRQMVVAANPLAAEAGLAILRKGGSAVDAAIATQMALNVVEPQSSGIGGGAFILAFDAKSKMLLDIDGRETAPSGATPRLFLDADGKPLPFAKAAASGRSVGVPGVLASLAMAHEKSGKLPWAALFAPAITLARDGFQISPRLAELLRKTDPKSFAPDARAYFFDAAGRPLPSGYRLTNPRLAETFEAIAKEGPSAFYAGPIAEDIAKAVTTDARGAGTLTAQDLADYRAKLREPICVFYRGFEVCGASPPSSGAIAVGQVLGFIEPFDLGASPFDPGAVHRIIEAERLAYADRDRYVADPDFVPVPSGLLDRDYLRERRALIDPAHAAKEISAGTPPNSRQGAYGRDATRENVGTSHISIVDGDGNAVSMTTSIEQAFGSRLMVRGFLLNNELTDFSFRPTDSDGKPIANRVEPGKRPRSAMDPTMIFADGRQLRYLLGSPGGPGIIIFNVKAIVALLDWKLDPQAAADLPTFGSTGSKLLLEEGPALNPTATAMARFGHDVARFPFASGLAIIGVTPEGLQGGADPRREGAALGD
jgi:gamma-glutamyltranspeptidase/glutathione hydrolase